jgi:Uri superfamily endonuclease
MAMDLSEAKGTYVLIAFVAQMKRLEIGRLGAYDIVPGYYAYVGSAFGAGGLLARIGHHLESTATPHWHIDYLLGVAEPVEVWYTRADWKLEHHWPNCWKRRRVFVCQFADLVPRIITEAGPATCSSRREGLLSHGSGERSRNTSKALRPNCIYQNTPCTDSREHQHRNWELRFFARLRTSPHLSLLLPFC